MSDGSAGVVLVTGAAGMLGSQVVLDAPPPFRAVGTDLSAGPGVVAAGLDVTEAGAVSALLRDFGPLVGVLHCAAYTAVDRAEEEPELARRINATACDVLARACAAERIPLVLVGTDFVFDGSKRSPYVESDEPRPLSVYGQTKLEGERLALAAHPQGTAVVRTQWLYGPRGRHFPRTIAALAAERGELRVVQDQVGSPTSTLELAPALWDVLRLGGRGVYHAACEGSCSWYELATAVLAGSGLAGVRLEPCGSGDFPRPAPRPAYSVLDSSHLATLRGRRLTHWRQALATYLALEPLSSPSA